MTIELMTKTDIGNAFSFLSSSATLDTVKTNDNINRSKNKHEPILICLAIILFIII